MLIHHRFNGTLEQDAILKALISEPGIGTTCMSGVPGIAEPIQQCVYYEGNFTTEYNKDVSSSCYSL